MTRRFVRSSMPSSWGLLVVALAVACALFASGPWVRGRAQSVQSRSADNVVLENDFIAIIVNAREEATGRFSVNTTGGDPERIGDENRPLIYGTVNNPGPVTSYTTVRIDGRDFVFGGPTQRRAGRLGLYSDDIEGPYIHEGREIHTVWRVEDVVVTQVLSIARGITTGQPDTARIEYRITNEGAVPRSVGLRVMLDTLLGSNDGAPFQVGGQAVLTDTAFRGDAIPDFFQAFDSLANPQIVSQGTLRAFDTTVPDEVYFSNWGSLADGVWNFEFVPERDFSRLGEEWDLDSAVALFWNERPLAPGETRSYVTYYGLGGITIAPGHLSIGVTSPASVDGSYASDVTFEVRAYIENTGDWIARDAVVRLEVPPPLRIAGGPPSVELGDMAPRDARQVSWRVSVPAETSGPFTYRVAVSSSNAEPNRVDRMVTVVAPARLEVSMPDYELSVEDGRWGNVPLPVTATITNTGQLDALDVEVALEPVLGLSLARGESPVRRPGVIAAGDSVDVTWHLVPTGVVGNLPVTLRLGSSNAAVGRMPTAFVTVPLLDATVRVAVGEDGLRRAELEPGDLFTVYIHAENVREFYGAALELHFDPSVVRVLGVSRAPGVDPGRAFVIVDPVSGERERLDWRAPEVDNVRGSVRIAGSRGAAGQAQRLSDTLAAVRFRAVAPGATALRLAPAGDHPYLAPDAQAALVARDDGTAVDVVTESATVTVRDDAP